MEDQWRGWVNADRYLIYCYGPGTLRLPDSGAELAVEIPSLGTTYLKAFRVAILTEETFQRRMTLAGEVSLKNSSRKGDPQ